MILVELQKITMWRGVEEATFQMRWADEKLCYKKLCNLCYTAEKLGREGSSSNMVRKRSFDCSFAKEW